MRTLSVQPDNNIDGSTVKVRISNAYLNLMFTKNLYNSEAVANYASLVMHQSKAGLLIP